MELIVMVVALLSPTFWLADLLKQDTNKNKVIRSLNWLYFLISVLSLVVLILLNNFFQTFYPQCEYDLPSAIWSIFLLSRCNEIFYAFLRDVRDKVADIKSENKKAIWCRGIIELKNKILHLKLLKWIGNCLNGNEIKNHDRLALSFRSYFELIINFAILYFLLPITHWKDCHSPKDILESFYFSGVTITTLGYGDITPTHWFAQLLSVYEVLCGFLLIIVCFAVYLRDEPKKTKPSTGE
jgi:hypothetical protein